MSARRLVALSGLLVLSGCLYHAREQADQAVCDLAAHPFDLPPRPSRDSVPAGLPAVPDQAAPGKAAKVPPAPPVDGQAVAWMQADTNPDRLAEVRSRFNLKVPREIPGAETTPVVLPKDPAEQQREIRRLYPELPPLPTEPTPLPGPNGQPYTLADLQQLAAANSPALRQAAADVEAAKGNLIQANAYPDPTVGLAVSPSNDGSTSGVWGPFANQTVRTGGKQKLAVAAAQMDLQNAELALRRARSDLATAVRNAYFAVLVARETVRVNKALARFTDEVYRLQEDLLEHGFAAPYEPAALRAQAYTARLALKQSIATSIYSWKQLVATVGLRQLPLTEVAGRIDTAIPYYDYDQTLALVLSNHTNVLTARNGIDKARYNLKLAQITPAYPDVSMSVAVQKELVLPPKQWTPTVTVGIPLPVWDTNKGNIIAAEGALVRASEEPHRMEVSLTNNLATAYVAYKNNLDALEYYRRYILPDQVRAYRGVFQRRQLDPSAAFGDLVAAQQTLAADVSTYLGILGSLWSSVAGVADFLQTDDLFQVAQPRELPPLPDLEHLPALPCCHPCQPPAGVTPAGANDPGSSASVSGAVPPGPLAGKDLSVPGLAETPAQGRANRPVRLQFSPLEDERPRHPGSDAETLPGPPKG